VASPQGFLRKRDTIRRRGLLAGDAAAVMGATIVTKAKPDGYTFYASDNSFYQNPAILDSLDGAKRLTLVLT
jgi:hypothetical protein